MGLLNSVQGPLRIKNLTLSNANLEQGSSRAIWRSAVLVQFARIFPFHPYVRGAVAVWHNKKDFKRSGCWCLLSKQAIHLFPLSFGCSATRYLGILVWGKKSGAWLARKRRGDLLTRCCSSDRAIPYCVSLDSFFFPSLYCCSQYSVIISASSIRRRFTAALGPNTFPVFYRESGVFKKKEIRGEKGSLVWH